MDSIRTGNKNGVLLEEYKGTYSLQAQRESNDGRFFTQWAKPLIGIERKNRRLQLTNKRFGRLTANDSLKEGKYIY